MGDLAQSGWRRRSALRHRRSAYAASGPRFGPGKRRHLPASRVRFCVLSRFGTQRHGPRAYAETVWFPTQFRGDGQGQPVGDDERQKAARAWTKIESVFGWAPHSDDMKPWKPQGLPRHTGDDTACSGSIVFHGAWPETGPSSNSTSSEQSSHEVLSGHG